MKIDNQNLSGLTLVESLVSILLLGIVISGLIGSFFISKLSISRAKHRYAAVNILKNYIEQEIAGHYDGGSDNEGDYYVTVASASPVDVTIDDRVTVDPSDDLIGTVTPDPYFPGNIEIGGNPIAYGGVPYKIVGFVINWNEDNGGPACSERLVTYVAYHSAS